MKSVWVFMLLQRFGINLVLYLTILSPFFYFYLSAINKQITAKFLANLFLVNFTTFLLALLAAFHESTCLSIEYRL